MCVCVCVCVYVCVCTLSIDTRVYWPQYKHTVQADIIRLRQLTIHSNLDLHVYTWEHRSKFR